MDSGSNEIQDLGLPPPATAQDGAAGLGQSSPPFLQGQPATAQAPTQRVADEDDSSTLDEEWVSKAKAIVDQTKSDPFLESRELSKIKADFLKARYNKHIKISEDHI